MTALSRSSPFGENDTASQTYNVRLLLADSEPNATSHGIAGTLLRFPELIYLDLSYTTPARDRMVLSSLSQLENLQVLKLRGIGLKDNDAEFLANAIGRRVRFLDLRNNLLTDMSIRSLLQACFLPPGAEDRLQRATLASLGSLAHSPQSRPLLADRRLLRTPLLDEQILKALTQSLTGRSWVEDLSHAGITHLYIAENPISVEGAASLLFSSRLHALDVGTVDTIESIGRSQNSLASPQEDTHKLPGAEKLIPILGSVAKGNLTYLRAHHAVCTVDAPSRETSTADMLLPELPAETESEVRLVAELGTNHEIYELPSNEAPVFELPGSPVPQSPDWPTQPAERGRKPIVYEDEPLPDLRRGSVFAPEVIGADQVTGSIPQCSSPLSVEDPRAQKIQELLAKRPKSLPRRDNKRCYFPYLHPSHVPHLETLVLTDVPSHVQANSPILESLIRFITACSNEALLATLQAGSDYSLAPGRARARSEQERARSLFGLRRLVLEITPSVESNRLSRWTPASHRIGASKSSTGDRDSEKLWSAAEGDFSFFGGEECGVPDVYSGKYFPMAALNEKVTLIPEDDDVNPLQSDMASSPNMLHPDPLRSRSNSVDPATTPLNMRSHSPLQGEGRDMGPHNEVPDVDLVAELAAFRRSKKAEYEDMLRRDRRRRGTTSTLSSRFSPSVSSFQTISPSSSINTLAAASAPHSPIAHYLEGHWKGEVKIVRNPAPKGRSGVVDMYGNYFEKGYLYP
ncbi:hypothetical protein ASPNIDRAFT_187314, partial [Aspergillus niger ATCC 1015]